MVEWRAKETEFCHHLHNPTYPRLALASTWAVEGAQTLSFPFHSEIRPKAQGAERYWPLWVAGVWLWQGEVEVENVAA